jgi:hypothetical protein
VLDWEYFWIGWLIGTGLTTLVWLSWFLLQRPATLHSKRARLHWWWVRRKQKKETR